MVLQLNLLDKLTSFFGSAFTLDINTTDAIIAGGQGAAQYVLIYNGAGSEKLKTVGSNATVFGNYNHNS